MREITHKTEWGKILYGEEYEIDEFVEQLDDNINSNNIKVDEKLHKITFFNEGEEMCSFSKNEITVINQYIEKDKIFDSYYYQVFLNDKTIREFVTYCFAGY